MHQETDKQRTLQSLYSSAMCQQVVCGACSSAEVKKGEPGKLFWPEGELVIADDAAKRSEWGEQERLNAVQKVQTEVGLSIKPEDLTYVGRETRNSRSNEEATATDCWMYVMPNHLKERNLCQRSSQQTTQLS